MAIIAGSAIAQTNRAGFMQARVEAITILEQGGAIKAFAKTEVLGPERLDSIHWTSSIRSSSIFPPVRTTSPLNCAI